MSSEPQQPDPPQGSPGGQPHEQAEYQTPPAAQPPPAGQQPGGQQPPPAGSSEGGMDPKVGGLLAYLLGWIGGLIIFLTQKDPELRFHGMQSILLNVAIIAIFVVLSILGGVLGAIPGVGLVAGLIGLFLTPLIGLASLALVIFMVIKGYNQEHYKLPWIGDMAENIAAGNNATA